MEMWQPTVDYQFVERRNELYGKVEEAIVLLIEKGLVLEKLKLVKAKSEEEIPLKCNRTHRCYLLPFLCAPAESYWNTQRR